MSILNTSKILNLWPNFDPHLKSTNNQKNNSSSETPFASLCSKGQHFLAPKILPFYPGLLHTCTHTKHTLTQSNTHLLLSAPKLPVLYTFRLNFRCLGGQVSCSCCLCHPCFLFCLLKFSEVTWEIFLLVHVDLLEQRESPNHLTQFSFVLLSKFCAGRGADPGTAERRPKVYVFWRPDFSVKFEEAICPDKDPPLCVQMWWALHMYESLLGMLTVVKPWRPTCGDLTRCRYVRARGMLQTANC